MVNPTSEWVEKFPGKLSFIKILVSLGQKPEIFMI